MKNRKIPMRSCVITKEKLPKNELLRIVRDPNGVVVVDTTGKINGRGAYIKKDKEVLYKAKKSKILERILEVPLSDEVYLEIEKIINN
ncbi:MAG: RNase P modulator RnpM [Bacilli bacterium]